MQSRGPSVHAELSKRQEGPELQSAGKLLYHVGGAPTDVDTRGDFLVESLEKSLMAFAEGVGSPIMTISCANSETYEQARLEPKKYDLLHARMRGWKEFSVTIFHAHQAQYQSCPFERPVADVLARSAHA